MEKIAFVGDKTYLEFFKVIGVEVFHAENPEEAEKILSELNLTEFITVFVSEESFCEETMQEYISQQKITVVPSLQKAKGTGYEMIQKLIAKATGMRT